MTEQVKLLPVRFSSEELALREEVREFLVDEVPNFPSCPGLGMDGAHSPEFSKKLAERGWVGMAIPLEYGGHGRTPIERFIVVEELLAVGAPVNAHWIADRQTAPTILRYGSELQRQRFLPAIAAGTCFFSIGMSEPDSGSDLASVRTTATAVENGWNISGTKTWTSGAHLNHFFVVLCRTSSSSDDRHLGLSQFIVDLRAPGVAINPIKPISDTQHFNEVVMDQVFVPTEMLLGELGQGWAQVTSELSFERSGPDRFLSTWPLLVAFLSQHDDLDNRESEHVGRLIARFCAIRQLALSVTRALQGGHEVEVEAAMLKDLGTHFEQELVATVQYLVDDDPALSTTSILEKLLGQAILASPSYTIRGGTTEILRSIIAQRLRVSG